MKLHDLAPPKGATTAKRRVGRGTGGKGHKTAGRGTKGQKARSTVPAGFEGGQLPLMQRIPKLKGFKNPFRVGLHPGQPGRPRRARNATRSPCRPWSRPVWSAPRPWSRSWARARSSRPVRVSAHAFSKSAEAAITAAGGSVERVPLPVAHGRPPASGNALMNR